jgi:hypothetical protein
MVYEPYRSPSIFSLLLNLGLNKMIRENPLLCLGIHVTFFMALTSLLVLMLFGYSAVVANNEVGYMLRGVVLLQGLVGMAIWGILVLKQNKGYLLRATVITALSWSMALASAFHLSPFI